jgi:hypothetical protein
VSLEGGSSCEHDYTTEPPPIELSGPESLLAAFG